MGLLPSPKVRCLPVSHIPGSCWAQALSMLDGLLQIRGSCSQGTLTQNNDKGLHLHDSTHDYHHLRLSTVPTVESQANLDACWGLVVQGKHPASRCTASIFQDKLLLHWTSYVVLVWTQMPGIPSEFFDPGILSLAKKVPVTIQRAAASKISIFAGMQPGRCSAPSLSLLSWASVTAGPLHRLKPPQGPSS